MDPIFYLLLQPFVPRTALPWTCGQCEVLNPPGVNACRQCEPEAYATEWEALCAKQS